MYETNYPVLRHVLVLVHIVLAHSVLSFLDSALSVPRPVCNNHPDTESTFRGMSHDLFYNHRLVYLLRHFRLHLSEHVYNRIHDHP